MAYKLMIIITNRSMNIIYSALYKQRICFSINYEIMNIFRNKFYRVISSPN